MNPETLLKNRVMADLATLPNIWFFKTQEVAVRGIPDIIICLRGMFIALELKRSAKQVPDELQEYVLMRIRDAKGRSFVVNPDNWPTIFGSLERLAA